MAVLAVRALPRRWCDTREQRRVTYKEYRKILRTGFFNDVTASNILKRREETGELVAGWLGPAVGASLGQDTGGGVRAPRLATSGV